MASKKPEKKPAYKNVNKKLLESAKSFKKRGLEKTTTEKKVVPEKVSKKSVVPQASSSSKLDAQSYKTMTGGSPYRFGVLTKIVKHMRLKYQKGEDHPLTIEEILEETNQLNVVETVKDWLITEAMVNNPKLEVIRKQGSLRFAFKPIFKVRNGKSLLRLLKNYDLRGMGGILQEDIEESLPNCEKVIQKLGNEVIVVTRSDKKKILFYNESSLTFQLDEEFKKLWRTIPVDSLEDSKIEAYLEKEGIYSMADVNPNKPLFKRSSQLPKKKKTSNKPIDNAHVADILETYDDNTLTPQAVTSSNNNV